MPTPSPEHAFQFGRYDSISSVKAALAHIAQALVIACYRVCGLFPTRKRVCMLSRQEDGSTRDFDLLATYIHAHHPGWDVRILAKKLHNPIAYLPHLLRQIYHIATARAVVLDSYCIPVSLLGERCKAPVLQMWHALGNMKKFGYMILDTPEGRSSSAARLMHMHEGYDSALVSSASFAADLAAGFRMDAAKLYEAPLPRVDLLVDPQARAAGRARAHEAFPQLANPAKRTIVYAPTFRRESSPHERAAMKALLDAIDFERYNLAYKPHPVSTQRIEDERVVQPLGPAPDLLYAADYVISDYSTLIYEAGLLEVPVYLYAYDWESYAAKRSLNIDLQRDVPTLFSDDPREIMAAIEAGKFDAPAYAAFTRANVTLPSHGSCTRRVAEHLFALIERQGA